MGVSVCSSKVEDDGDYDYEYAICWQGPYSAFTRWRHALCRAAGWHLEEHAVDFYTYLWPREVNADALTPDNYQGKWDRLPEDALILLVAHSDCDGELPPEALEPLAQRLEGLVPLLPAPADDPEYREDTPRAIYDGVRAATIRFAVGLRAAHAYGHRVTFG